MKRRSLLIIILFLFVISVMGCGSMGKKDSDDSSGLQCEFQHSESVSRVMGSFTRDLQVYADVSGGNGEYIYTFIVNNEEGKIVAYVEDVETSGISFTVKENLAMDVLVKVKDSEGASKVFLYHIDRYQ